MGRAESYSKAFRQKRPYNDTLDSSWNSMTIFEFLDSAGWLLSCSCFAAETVCHFFHARHESATRIGSDKESIGEKKAKSLSSPLLWSITSGQGLSTRESRQMVFTPQKKHCAILYFCDTVQVQVFEVQHSLGRQALA